jgi:hypothetical protein
MLGTACNLVDGLSRLQEVDCVGACESDAGEAPADGGLDATPVRDTGIAPIDATMEGGEDAVAPLGDGGPQGSDASSDGGDGEDGRTSLVYIGCFADSMTRDLPISAYDNPMNTPDLCIATCSQAGYAFAGLQNATQCYCGNAYGGQGPSNGCVDPCSGDAAAVCGGAYNNSVYATSPASIPRPPKYVGCFAEGTPRDLPDGVYASDFSTPGTCVAACAYYGYLYAGAQDSTQCFCGDSYGAYGTSLGCIDPCSGAPSDICGGNGSNSIYRTPITDAGADDAG